MNPISKAVVAAAGIGTRLLPMTKNMPKEMLPLFYKGENGEICLKPVVQYIFEQLYDVGFREFCIIVGRGGRSIVDHFTPEMNLVEHLKHKNKTSIANGLEEFYDKITNSTITFSNQRKPMGFGDAVLRARNFTGEENFLVHAGDDLVLSRHKDHIRKLIGVFDELEADAVLLCQEVRDPRKYGVIHGEEVLDGVYRLKKIVEKPKTMRSGIAVIAIYVFKPAIYEEIASLKPDKNDELQLTDAIQSMIKRGRRVYALQLTNGERIDTGTPETYWKALNTMYKSVKGGT